MSKNVSNTATAQKMYKAKSQVFTEIERRRGELAEVLRDITRIPSVFGNEGPCQEYIARELRLTCDEVDIWEPNQEELSAHPSYRCPGTKYGGRPNVVGVIRGTRSGRSLLVNAHADVVPPGDRTTWKHDPWGGEIEAGRMYGRGVMDDKAGLAAMILIARVLRETGIKLAGDVSLESVVGEEWGGGGSLGTLLRGHKGDAVIVIEPTELKVCNVCRGGATFQIIVSGRGAHPIEPEKGISAIEKAYAVLRSLANLRDIRQERLTRCFNGEHPNLTPLLVGGIEGEIAQKVPERCILRGLIGFPPDEGFADVKADLEGFVANVASLDPWLRNHPPIVTWDGFMKEGCEVMVDDPFVRSCLKAQAEVLGRDIPAGTFRAACDLHYYVRYWGIPGIIFGPGNCVVAHSSDEWVDLTELLVFTKALAGMILQWSL